MLRPDVRIATRCVVFKCSSLSFYLRIAVSGSVGYDGGSGSNRLRTIVFLSCLPFLAAGEERIATPIENEWVKVLDVTVQPREKTRLHEHKANRVMIYLDAGKQHLEYQGSKATDLKFRAGEVLWSPQGGMHTSEITSAKPVRIIEIELKKPGAGKSVTAPRDPVKVDPKHYHVEFENDQVRVVRVRIGPNETAPLHEHAVNRVGVYLTDQNFRVTSADGKVENPQRKAGEVAWGTPSRHTETNASDKPFEVIMVELKS